ncbi:MAG: HAD-IB family hydrolase [Actinobacteria bacterium]|nr:HAD-IB family hydrolase [Actinomycetota bacterium]
MSDSPDQYKAAAFFDLDGTLIKGSANIPFAISAFKKGLVSKKQLLVDIKNGVSFKLKGATDERSAEVRDRILEAVKGQRVDDIVAIADDFMAKLVSQVQPEMAEVLAEQKAMGNARVILSASPTEIVSRLAKELGLEYGIGTTAAHENGIYTGVLAGPFCYREGKAEIIRSMCAEHGWPLEDCYAYSDSLSDLPMMEVVGHPVAVNPETELREKAGEDGWPVVETSNIRSMRKRDMPKAAAKNMANKLHRSSEEAAG